MRKIIVKFMDTALDVGMRVAIVITFVIGLVAVITGIVLLFAALGWFVSHLNFIGI